LETTRRVAWGLGSVASLPLLTACTSDLSGGDADRDNGDSPDSVAGSGDPGPSEGAETVIVGDVECASHTAGHTPIRLLTKEQIGRLVEQSFPGIEPDADILASFPQTLQSAGYNSNAGASVDAIHQQRLLELAEDVATKVMDRLDEFVDCEPDVDCARELASSFGRRSYRRSLDDEQLGELVALFGTAEDPKRGMHRLIQGLLLAPDALYQYEVGVEVEDGTRRLQGIEVASKLSFVIFGEAPDDALLDAAEAGNLDTRGGVAEQTRSMLEDPRAEGILRFFKQWLHFSHIGDKDADLFPAFTEEVAESAIEESERFISHVLFDDDARFETLLNDTTAFVTPALASIYGLEVESAPTADPPPPVDPTGECSSTVGCRELYDAATDCSNAQGGVCLCGDELCAEISPVDVPQGELDNESWSQVSLDPNERGGLLTRIAFLAATGGTRNTSHITRGVDLQANVLCLDIPEPGADIQDEFPLIPDDSTLVPRDIIELHQAEPTCEACHQFIDGVGLGFESYDPIGAYRTSYVNGRPVDDQGDIFTNQENSGVDGPFSGATGFSDVVSSSQLGRACFSENWFRFALLRSPVEDNCSLALAQEAFTAGDFNIKDLIVGMVQSPDFRFRGAH